MTLQGKIYLEQPAPNNQFPSPATTKPLLVPNNRERTLYVEAQHQW